MKSILTSILLSLTVVVASGCASRSAAPSAASSLGAPQSDGVSLPIVPNHGIEVTWEMPGEPVDGFVIRYGDTPETLSREVTISTSDIKEESDPEFGPVYRYLIKDVVDTKNLFVSIAAVKGQSISHFSEVLEAQAAEPLKQ